MKEQKVSIVMCTYNGEKFLKEQMESIVNQTYPIYELIIQDDCSTDDTYSILQKYSERYPYIYVYQNDENLGVNRNFFSAMKKVSGDYIAISDQDDIWELDKIENQVNSIGDNLLSFCFSRPFATEKDVFIHFDSRIPNYALERFIYVGGIPGHTILFKRKFLEILDKMKIENYNMTYDRLLSMLAASYGKIHFCDKILVNHRRHINAVTYTPPNNYRKSAYNIVGSIFRTFSLFRELRPIMKERFGEIYRLLKEFPNDASYTKDAIKLAYYHSQSSIVSYIKLTFLCVRLRHKIFYANTNNSLFVFLRALYFQISCSDYFRYLSKKI